MQVAVRILAYIHNTCRHLQVSVGDETEILINSRCCLKMTAHSDMCCFIEVRSERHSMLKMEQIEGIQVISVLLAFSLSVSERNTPTFNDKLCNHCHAASRS